MEKEAKGMRSCCPKLTRIENLTRGLTTGNNQEDMFLVRELDGKGRGVFLKASILPKDSFVLEYEGDIVSAAEADIREQIYCANGEGCFIMYFTFKDMKMAVDATRRFESFGRLVNHSRHPNIRFHKPLVIDLMSGMPRIAAYALRDIKQGEEIVMDYGIRDGDIPWLKNSKAGFLASVDTDSDLAENSSQCSSKTSEKMSSISLMEASGTGTKTTACNNLNKLQKVDMLPGIVNCGIKSKKMATIFGYSFKNFVPDGRKRSYFAAYNSFNAPEEIKRISDEPTKKIRKHQSHNDTSVNSCCKQLENDKLPDEKERFSEFNNELSSEESHCTVLSYVKEVHRYELSGVSLRSKRVYCNERSSLKTDSIKLPGEKEVYSKGVLGKKYSDSGSNISLSKRQSDAIQSSSLGNRVNRSEVFQNTNHEEEDSSEEFHITNHGKKDRCEKCLNKDDAERDKIEVFHNTKDDEKENFIDLKSGAGIEINHPLHQSLISLNETVVAKFLVDSKIEQRSEVILWELPNLQSPEDVPLNKIKNLTAENDIGKDICRKLKTSECDILLPKVAGSCIQSGMLSRSRQRRGSLSASPQVAVIKPYNPECLSDQSSCKEHRLDAKEGIEKVSAIITEAEKKHLRSLFQGYGGINKVLRNDIVKLVKKNEAFLVKLISRGVTKDQITITIRQFFMKTSNAKP